MKDKKTLFIQHRVNSMDELKEVSHHYGVETDIRIYKDDWDKTIRIINSNLHKNYNSNSNWLKIEHQHNNIFQIDLVKSDYTQHEPKWENVDYIFEKETELIYINDIQVYGPHSSLIQTYLTSTFGNNWNQQICHLQKNKKYVHLTNFVLFLIVLLCIYFLHQKHYFMYLTPLLLLIIFIIIMSSIYSRNKYVETR